MESLVGGVSLCWVDILAASRNTCCKRSSPFAICDSVMTIWISPASRNKMCERIDFTEL